MAEYALIDRYLGELRHMLRRSPEADDIVAEVADHLLEGVSQHRDNGVTSLVAERFVLTEFGDPTLVGRAFASSKHGGIAVPTTFTKRAGLLGVASAVLYVAASFSMLVYNQRNETGQSDWDATFFGISTYTYIAAGLLLVALVVGLNRRHGGALGKQGRWAAYVLGAAGVTSFALWFWAPWLTLTLAGALLVGSSLVRAGLAPRWASLAVQVGAAIPVGAMWVTWLLPESTADQDFGDDPTILFALAGFIIFATGIAGLGAWLLSETPVDEPDNLLTV